MTFLNMSRRIIELWFNATRDLPLNQCRGRLEHIVAVALDQTSQDAYARGFRDAVLAEIKNGEDSGYSQLAQHAQRAGAQGTWLIRGAKNFDLLFNLPGEGIPIMLNLEDADLIFVARFPTANGGEPGIEHH